MFLSDPEWNEEQVQRLPINLSVEEDGKVGLYSGVLSTLVSKVKSEK